MRRAPNGVRSLMPSDPLLRISGVKMRFGGVIALGGVSFGVGYTEVSAHLESTRSSQAGLFDFSTQGPEMFFRIAF